MRSSEGLWRVDEPSYHRSWEDIEEILDLAIELVENEAEKPLRSK